VGYVSGLRDAAASRKPKNQVLQAAAICINLELLMMGVIVPETCWANSKFCDKKTNLLHPVGFLFARINDDVPSDSHQKINVNWNPEIFWDPTVS
jgi:hypothetical protein